MTYVKTNGEGGLLAFPYSDAKLRRDHPLVSFPRVLTDPVRANFDVFPVIKLDRPSVTDDQAAERDSLPRLSEGAWVLGWSQRAKSETELEADQVARLDEGKAECRRRIFAVVDEMAQINLAAAAGAGLLSGAQHGAYISGLGWIQLMRTTWPALVEAGADLSDDANWPAVPDGAAALVAAF